MLKLIHSTIKTNMLSEITESQAQKHNNSFEINGDLVQLRDPFTGENLSSERPPRSLESMARLAAGFDYLRGRKDITNPSLR